MECNIQYGRGRSRKKGFDVKEYWWKIITFVMKPIVILGWYIVILGWGILNANKSKTILRTKK